ncbi:MAG: hypothetical protein ABSG03_07010 [Bryobacteraceae bacterium]|jgi:hypothetical protein
MDEEDIVALARMLVKRLSDSPDPHSNGWQEVVNQAIRGVRKFLGKRPDPPTAVPWQWLLVARIRTLPEHIQEPLRRYYVFREAEESICLSLRTRPEEFRRFLREATDYILLRRERLPEFDPQRQSPGRQGA